MPRDWALVLDLDGVVVDVRASYRLAYLDGLAWHLTHDLGLAVDAARPLAAVHLLKRHPGFNAPAEVVAVLLRLALRAVLRDAPPMASLTPQVAEALTNGALDAWRTTTLALLSPEERAWLLSREDAAQALAAAHEAYAGSADVRTLYGQSPLRQMPGLWHHDRLLLDPLRPPPPVPLGVLTGRAPGETSWLLRRFRFFDQVAAVHANAPKPDGRPLLALQAELGGGPLLYVGDLPADRDTVLDARKLGGRDLLVGQIVGPDQPERWPEADFAAADLHALLAQVG
jgi:phosphoglycolate phosphatase-like HAD superfamily hydrolase